MWIHFRPHFSCYTWNPSFIFDSGNQWIKSRTVIGTLGGDKLLYFINFLLKNFNALKQGKVFWSSVSCSCYHPLGWQRSSVFLSHLGTQADGAATQRTQAQQTLAQAQDTSTHSALAGTRHLIIPAHKGVSAWRKLEIFDKQH